MNQEIINLVKNIQDDAELGRRVRALVNLISSPFGEGYNSNNTGHSGYNSTNNKGLLNG